MTHYEEVNVSGYDEFCGAVSQRKGKDVFVYFSGDKDAEGKSWCPDCVKAEPVVRGEMTHLPEGSVFIYCQVGERAYGNISSVTAVKTGKIKLEESKQQLQEESEVEWCPHTPEIRHSSEVGGGGMFQSRAGEDDVHRGLRAPVSSSSSDICLTVTVTTLYPFTTTTSPTVIQCLYCYCYCL